MTEVYDYDYWFNKTEAHGNVYEYGPNYCHNKIIKEIVFNLDLPQGKIVMLGSHRCYGLDMLCKKYGDDRVLGVDLYNPTNHPCVITSNILDFNSSIDCSFIINDIGNFLLTPSAKIHAQEWAANNTVKGGFVLSTTNKNSANYLIEEYMLDRGFTITRLTSFNTVSIPDWALQAYVLYQKT